MGSDPGPRRAVVLLSGGLDSATTLAWAIDQGFEAHALTVDYGQRHRVEIARAVELARTLGAASHRVVRVDLSHLSGSALVDPDTPVPVDRDEERMASEIPVTYVPARNALLLAIALGLAETLDARDLMIGANAVDYSGYPDCRPEFLEAFESMARVATRSGVEGRGARVHAPLVEWTKARIVQEAVRLGVDLGRTVSCYEPSADGRPCRRCDACRLRERGFREAGIEDPAG